MMKLLRLAAVLMLAVFSFSVTADTGVGFKSVEKDQVFASNVDVLSGLLSLKSESVAEVKNIGAEGCSDTETTPCRAESSPLIVVSMTNWPDPLPVPAVTASNSITRDSCHMIEVSSVVRLQPG